MNPRDIPDKLVGNEDERAVSPVIGVILMVAITVILAAVLAAFVLDLGDTSEPVQASFGIDEDTTDGNLTVTVRDASRLDSVNVAGCDDEDGIFGDAGGPSVGNSVELDYDGGDIGECGSGDTINIVGVYQGSEQVIRSYQIEGED